MNPITATEFAQVKRHIKALNKQIVAYRHRVVKMQKLALLALDCVREHPIVAEDYLKELLTVSGIRYAQKAGSITEKEVR